MNENTINNKQSVSIAIVTNMPAPYRIPIFKILAHKFGYENFKVIYCTVKEGNRDWKLSQNGFNFSFLKERTLNWNGRFIHFNFDVLRELRQLKPDVVITTGFNPTFLLAFGYAFFYKKKHIPMTDGTLESEQTLTIVHRLVRSIIYRFSKAFIGTSLGSFSLYKSFGISQNKIFKSHLCANNLAFQPSALVMRPIDLMFSGRFSPEKNPIFALDVAQGVAKRLNRKVSLIMLGSGQLLDQAKKYAFTLASDVEVIFPGFVQQEELPQFYCSAKVFLFPSSWDPWGVVANEACAAGQAVIISPHAGAANDLVVHGENGYVLALDLDVWIKHAADLLSNVALIEQFSKDSLLKVQSYTYEVAAKGVVDAVHSDNVKNMSKVVVVQRRLTHYRVSFFEELKRELALRGVQLILVYGQPDPIEAIKQDEGHIEWAIQVVNRYWKIGNRYLVFQPYLSQFEKADLVVITQENSILSNYRHLLCRALFGAKVAFWGHGANLRSENPNGPKERFKRWTTMQVDWWFAYTQLSADLVCTAGFPRSRVTVLNNSIDTADLQCHRQTISPEETHALQVSLGFDLGPVCVFVGSLYADKRLDFLFASADAIRRDVPDFNLLIVGDGNERNKVKDWCANRPWARWVGSRLGREKVAYISMAQIMLNPGLVGLGILDSFVCEVPMLTTACGLHSPEISYLENEVNGVMTADDLNIYVTSCVSLLRDSQKLEVLRKGCRASAKEYTIKNMARHFSDGVMSCLDVSDSIRAGH